MAVRVVDPSNTPIDGLLIRECPGRNRVDPWAPGACYNNGGLTDCVELLIAPAVRVESLYVKPDWQSGRDRGRGERPERDGATRHRAMWRSAFVRRRAATCST